MIKIKTVIQFRGVGAATQRDLKSATREELRALGEHWHGQYLPLHFETSAYRRYGSVYTQRTIRYNARKGHKRPMVYSGVLREQATAFAQVRASTRSVRVRFGTARALNFSSKVGYPDMRAELTAISPEEANTFARRMDEGVSQRLKRLKTARTVKVD